MTVFLCVQDSEKKPYKLLAPRQGPINPPYKMACELKKSNQLDTSSIVNPVENSETEFNPIATEQGLFNPELTESVNRTIVTDSRDFNPLSTDKQTETSEVKDTVNPKSLNDTAGQVE